MASETGIEREIPLAFWKVHVLHHADEEPVIGQWILRELQSHGDHVGPGTPYPLLARLERRGWLRNSVAAGGGPLSLDARLPRRHSGR